MTVIFFESAMILREVSLPTASSFTIVGTCQGVRESDILGGNVSMFPSLLLPNAFNCCFMAKSNEALTVRLPIRLFSIAEGFDTVCDVFE